MEDLRNKTLRAGLANVSGRVVTMLLRIVSIVMLARLLTPRDYGLVGEVTACIGVLSVVSSFGLSQAAIQRDTMSEERASTLFWLNILLGGVLTATAIALAPAISAFYREPQLVGIAVAVAFGFLLSAAGIQHSAMLQRQMRFGTWVVIDTCSMLLATLLAIGLAAAGFGYWALVSTTISQPCVTTVGLWLASGWIPGRPRRGTGVRSLVQFGGTMTLHWIVDFIAKSFGSVLLGRIWGADTLGLFGRAQSLFAFATDTLNTTIGGVAFAALSRAKNDSARLRRYFLAGYSLVVSLTVPLAILPALFADELTRTVLGPNWADTAPVLRALSPAILVYAIGTPLGWLMNALGLVQRGLKMALISAPLIVVGSAIGVRYGAEGVATGYSVALLLTIGPYTLWAVHGTPVRVSDIFAVLRLPLVAGALAGAIAYDAHVICAPIFGLLLQTATDVAIFGAVYAGVLFSVKERRTFYARVLRATVAAATP